jgi:hypothetical protein
VCGRGQIVDDSSRRLRQTRDVHRGYGAHLDSGAETLHTLKREERNANIFLACCFLAFFVVAFYVAQRRIVNSNTATYIVSPAYRVATFVPRRAMRIARALLRATVGPSGLQEVTATSTPSFAPVVGAESAPNSRKPPNGGERVGGAGEDGRANRAGKDGCTGGAGGEGGGCGDRGDGDDAWTDGERRDAVLAEGKAEL